MFVRKKTNRSGTISVVVVSKAHGKFTEVKKFGVAKSEAEADELFQKAQSCGFALIMGSRSWTSIIAEGKRLRRQNVSQTT